MSATLPRGCMGKRRGSNLTATSLFVDVPLTDLHEEPITYNFQF